MLSRVKYIKALSLVLLPLFTVVVSSCENDLNKVKEIASNEKGEAVDATTGVDLIMSDSAVVVIHLTSPLMLQYHTKKPYKLMPRGVKVVHYDKATTKEDFNIVADTGIAHDDQKLIEFHKNVVATNAKGETYKSDELYWDQVTKKVYSHKPVQVTLEGGNVMNGDSFESDDQFLHPSLKSSTGIFHVDEKVTQ
ncbi:MAG TPA: LPS export ABC transporter periplasmic protein LptC [Mucilaginibacter sp.]